MTNYKKILKENKILESNRLILRPFSIADVEDVFSYASDDKVTKYLTWETHTDLLQAEKVVRGFYMNNDGIYAIELKSEHRCIGCIDLRIDTKNDKGSFGYVMNRSYWNNGYISEALYLILNLAFEKLELNRIESTYYAGNEASGSVMKKCGMEYEGTGLQELKIKGVYHDVIHYAMLKEKWIDLINN